MRHSIRHVAETIFRGLSAEVRGVRSPLPEETAPWSDGDWRVARTIVFMHGMGPLWGAKCIEGGERPFMPDHFRDYLIQQYHENTVRILGIREMYHRVGREFSRRNIALLPFKGIHLAERLYGDMGQRPMADIDLYVPSDDRAGLVEIMEGLGFLPVAVTDKGMTFCAGDWLEENEFFPDMEEEIDADSPLYHGENPDSPMGIDIHWKIKNESICGAFDMTALFDDCAGPGARELSGEVRFVHLLLHAAKHILGRSGRWLHLYDIFLYGKLQEWDVAAMAGHGADLRVEHLLLAPLVLSRKLFGGEVSPLESSLAPQVGLRHRMLIDRLCLSEMSCCYPWAANPLAQLAWANSLGGAMQWLAGKGKVDNGVLLRKEDSLQPDLGPVSRALNRLKVLSRKQPRDNWRGLAAHGLDPKIHWN